MPESEFDAMLARVLDMGHAMITRTSPGGREMRMGSILVSVVTAYNRAVTSSSEIEEDAFKGLHSVVSAWCLWCREQRNWPRTGTDPVARPD